MKKIISAILVVIMMVTATIGFTSCNNYEMKIGKDYAPIDAQVDVLMQLNAKSIDVGVMDSIMAGYYMSQDTKYSNSLMIINDLSLATEQYGIAARKGSGLTKKINKAIVELANEGVVDTLAEKYGIKSELCVDKTLVIEELTEAELADWNYIVGQGKVIVGYTDFAPISYTDADGVLKGFDVELAKAVLAKYGLTPEFKLINWNTKEALLNGKTIDCIWNGMTITEQRKEEMEVSIPYLNNKQVAVIRKEDAEKYKTTADMAEAIMGAESGSAGENCIIVVEEE